jgi:cell division protein FtsB
VDTNNLYTALITLITVLGGAGAWKFYERRLEMTRQKEKEEDEQVHLFRDDLRERVAVLESKLEESSKREVTLLEEIRRLSETVAALKVEIEYLRRENNSLRENREGREENGSD